MCLGCGNVLGGSPGISAALLLSTALILSLDRETGNVDELFTSKCAPGSGDCEKRDAVAKPLQCISDKLRSALESAIVSDQERTYGIESATATTIDRDQEREYNGIESAIDCANSDQKRAAFNAEPEQPELNRATVLSSEERGRFLSFNDYESRTHDRFGKLPRFDGVVSATALQNCHGRHGGASRNR